MSEKKKKKERKKTLLTFLLFSFMTHFHDTRLTLKMFHKTDQASHQTFSFVSHNLVHSPFLPLFIRSVHSFAFVQVGVGNWGNLRALFYGDLEQRNKPWIFEELKNEGIRIFYSSDDCPTRVTSIHNLFDQVIVSSFFLHANSHLFFSLDEKILDPRKWNLCSLRRSV